MAEDNLKERPGVVDLILGVATSIAAVLAMRKNKPAESIVDLPQSPNPVVEKVETTPVEVAGVAINYTPLPSSTATAAAVADASIQ